MKTPAFRNGNISFATDENGILLGYARKGGYAPINHGRGYRAALFGDSMTSQHMEDFVSTTATYDKDTGYMYIPLAAHGLPTGAMVSIYNVAEPGLQTMKRVKITRIDANTISAMLPPNLQISAAIGTNTFVRPDSAVSSKGWFTWLQIFSGYRFNLVANGAQSGNLATIGQNSVYETCLDFQPQVVFMQLIGINDLGASKSIDEIWAAQKKILDDITANCFLVCCTPTPVLSGHSIGNVQSMSRLVQMRNRLFDYARNNNNIVVIDTYRLVVDPTDATGLAKASPSYIQPVDKIHYTPLGAWTVGKLVWDTIQQYFPSADIGCVSMLDSYDASKVTLTSQSRANNILTCDLNAHGFLPGETVRILGGSPEVLNIFDKVLTATANSFTVASEGAAGAVAGTVTVSRNNNMFATPLLLTTTGGTISGANISGTAAANIRVNQTGTFGAGGSIVASVVANPSGFGNNQQVVVTPGTSPSSATATIQVQLNNSMLPFLKAGRRYIFEAEVTLANVLVSTLTELRVRFFVTVDGVSYDNPGLKAVDGLNAGIEDGTYMMRSGEFIMPEGTPSAIEWHVAMRFLNTTSAQAVTCSVGRIRALELDTL